MPGLDGTQIIEKLQRDRPELRLLVLTVHENIHYAVRVIESGAHGYMIKSAAVEELVDAIHRVHDGELYLSPKIASQVLQHMLDAIGVADLETLMREVVPDAIHQPGDLTDRPALS